MAAFRQAFNLPSREVLRWFPGHMHKGMERIQATLKDIDCIIEIHDARIPFSGRNPRFSDMLELRPHLLLLNKSDLAFIDNSRQTLIESKLTEQGVSNVFFTDLRRFQRNTFLKNVILPSIIKLTESKPRFSRQGLNEYNVMVIGVPNVGKSTFINTVRWANIGRKGRAANVGAMAGVTKGVTPKVKVNTDPAIYVIDTPGIFRPNLPDAETGMRLALCACLPDHLVEEETIADYLLYYLNKSNNFTYVDHYELLEPLDNILDILAHIAKKDRTKILKVRDIATNTYKYRPDFKSAAIVMIKDFRSGVFGRTFLDEDKLE